MGIVLASLKRICLTVLLIAPFRRRVVMECASLARRLPTVPWTAFLQEARAATASVRWQRPVLPASRIAEAAVVGFVVMGFVSLVRLFLRVGWIVLRWVVVMVFVL